MQGFLWCYRALSRCLLGNPICPALLCRFQRPRFILSMQLRRRPTIGHLIRKQFSIRKRLSTNGNQSLQIAFQNALGRRTKVESIDARPSYGSFVPPIMMGLDSAWTPSLGETEMGIGAEAVYLNRQPPKIKPRPTTRGFTRFLNRV
jgi:hypothetical protein